MHGEEGPLDDFVLGDEEGGFSIWAAAEGEDGVDDGLARVRGDDGVEPQCWKW